MLCCLRSRAAIIGAALLFFAVLSGCQRGAQSMSRNPMPTLSSRLKPMFEKTRTVCFGRFVIQVPATATVVYGPSEVDTPIEYFEGHGARIEEYIAMRLSEVEEERQFLLKSDLPKLPLFGKVIDGARPGQKIVFGSKDRVGYAVHSFVRTENDLFVQHVDSIQPDENIVGTFNQVASHLHSRSDEQIPAEPGVCIQGGFVPLEPEYERVTIGIRFHEISDVHISIDAHKNQQYLPEESGPGALRAKAKVAAEGAGLGATFARTKILREGARQIATWNGEEVALRTPAYKADKSVHEFRFHSAGSARNSLRPELDIRLDSGITGNKKASVDPSLTDEEALALWDRVVMTIRVRRPSDATPVFKGTERIPLASLVRSGDACPQTGWWECSEGTNIDGGTRSLLNSGDVVPRVLTAEGLTVWQKFVGERRAIATVWKLVGYNDEPGGNDLGASR